MLKPKLFSIIKHRDKELDKSQLMKDIVAGVIVAIIALPLSLALAIASGVSPERGIITAIVAGFFISFLGGSRVQIGGPTGAFVVIVYGIVQDYGLKGLTIATIMSGIILIIFGIMRFGSLIRYIPYPITTGFTSGIAIVLLSTQVKDFLGLHIKDVPSEFIPKWSSYFSHIGTINMYSLVAGVIALLMILLWPRFNKTIPGSLVALIIVTIGVKLLNLPVETIGSRFGEISSSIPRPHMVHLDLHTIKVLINPAITIAILAGIESLLSAVVADGMIGKKHNSNMELIAQGVANTASAIFGGIPATGAIARTAANVKNGGRTPVAGVVHAISLLLIMLIFMPFAKLVPMTVLAAILIVVSYNMSEWRAFKALLKAPKSDVLVLVVTFLLTVIFDLVTAIEIGMLFAMFLFMRKMAINTNIRPITSDLLEEDDDDYEDKDGVEYKKIGKNVLVYEINGPFFFGAAHTFLDVMNEVKTSSDILILRMRNVPVMDATAFDVLKRIDARCRKHHMMLMFSEIQAQPEKLMRDAGFVNKIGEDRLFQSLDEALMTANEIVQIKLKANSIRNKTHESQCG